MRRTESMSQLGRNVTRCPDNDASEDRSIDWSDDGDDMTEVDIQAQREAMYARSARIIELAQCLSYQKTKGE